MECLNMAWKALHCLHHLSHPTPCIFLSLSASSSQVYIQSLVRATTGLLHTMFPLPGTCLHLFQLTLTHPSGPAALPYRSLV